MKPLILVFALVAGCGKKDPQPVSQPQRSIPPQTTNTSEPQPTTKLTTKQPESPRIVSNKLITDSAVEHAIRLRLLIDEGNKSKLDSFMRRHALRKIRERMKLERAELERKMNLAGRELPPQDLKLPEEPESETLQITKADLHKVRQLNLNGTEVTDASLKEVAKLKQLYTLEL